MARSTRLVFLIKNRYILWGRKRLLLPVTYFPTNLVLPFTLRVTDIKTDSYKPTYKGTYILKDDPNRIINQENNDPKTGRQIEKVIRQR